MMRFAFIVLALALLAPVLHAQKPTAGDILARVERNLSSRNRVHTATMVIHTRRGDRTITAKSWSEGSTRALTEYLSPAREKGTKMLKLEGQLWIYTPATDRTIQISGHMLRQSVMGSDLSYEDMMEDRKLTEVYDAELTGEASVDERACWVLALTAKVPDVAYQRRTMWIDRERLVPLKEELSARSGQLLKKTEYRDVRRIGGRWFPMVAVFRDMLKDGDGTEFRITDIAFDQPIPESLFSKAALRK
jgi:outer membrane lipoprotein-sorting protein